MLTRESVALWWMALMGAIVGFIIGHGWNKPKDITDKLEKIDVKYYEKFEDKRHANDIISSGISDGTIRLHVRTDTEATAGVADGQGTRCNIHATDAQRIIEVTKRADECSSRLTGLQEWVKEHK